jgi:hypothetical protein
VQRLPSNLLAEQEMLILMDTKEAGPGRLSARIKPIQSKPTMAKLKQSSSTLLVDSDGSHSVTDIKKSSSSSRTSERKEVCQKRGWSSRVQELPDGTQVLGYQIDEEGEYEVELVYGGRPVPNTKRVVHVSTGNEAMLTAANRDAKCKLKVVLSELCVQLITLRFLFERQSHSIDSNADAVPGAAHLPLLLSPHSNSNVLAFTCPIIDLDKHATNLVRRRHQTRRSQHPKLRPRLFLPYIHETNLFSFPFLRTCSDSGVQASRAEQVRVEQVHTSHK